MGVTNHRGANRPDAGIFDAVRDAAADGTFQIIAKRATTVLFVVIHVAAGVHTWVLVSINAIGSLLITVVIWMFGGLVAK